MTLDGFLTFLTIVLAAYAVMPSATRLRLALRRGSIILISTVTLALTLYFLFFSAFSRPCFAGLSSYCNYITFGEGSSITPSQAAFLTLICWLFLTSLLVGLKWLPSRSLPALNKLLSELMHEGRYGDVADILKPQLSLLSKAANRKLLCTALYDQLRKLHPGHFDLQTYLHRQYSQRPRHKVIELIINGSLRTISTISILIPSGTREEGAATDILRGTLRHPDFAKYVALHRPHFGIEVLSREFRGAQDFSDAFLGNLIENPQSILYVEVKENQNTSNCGYDIPEHNKVLSFYLGNSQNAYRLAPYRPIGEHLLASLRPTQDPNYLPFLNGSAEFFDDFERWNDKTFVGLRFFDIMVCAAACQGIHWHMWLYYYPHFLEKLVSNYDSTAPEIDHTAEWPTRASYLIYCLFNALVDWVRLGRSLPEGSAHLAIDNSNPTHQNDNIPKSAALALGQCMSCLLSATNIDERFRRYIHDIVLRELESIPKQGREAIVRELLIRCILNRGPFGTQRGYGIVLRDFWNTQPVHWKIELADYHTALLNAYP